jgi:radical SAM superfamily enzyme YgiQ (UPF0313 family)
MTAGSTSDVVLATINARYPHASLGLRYLLANAGELRSRMALQEFALGRPVEEIASSLLALQPRVIGLAVYIWNVAHTQALVARLKTIAPQVRIVLGGPEVSHETESQPICRLADHVVQGPGDLVFAQLAARLLEGGGDPPPWIIAAAQPDLAALALPYREYDDTDVRERILYVEASRGCPFKCEFCLSSLDRTAWPFPLAPFLAEMDDLHLRGARRFKFVDRTFNLKPATSTAIMAFFLERIEATPQDPCFVHFELVPDHLPDTLKAAIARFPAGTLQFEIGIQTFDPTVQALISRRQHDARAEANLRWLLGESAAHLHVDLIAGLPAQTLDSLARDYDRLVAIGPHEIQVGILKRLRGAPIARHEAAHAMRFASEAPYEVIDTAAMSADELNDVRLVARVQELTANSGRMPSLLRRIHADAPFARMRALARYLEARFGRVHAIGLEPLFDGVVDWLATLPGAERTGIERDALQDYAVTGASGRLGFMARGLAPAAARPVPAGATPRRQARRLRIDTRGPGVL